ncbi:MAG: NUDIX hydrolase [Haloechinothrix sp.]
MSPTAANATDVSLAAIADRVTRNLLAFSAATADPALRSAAVCLLLHEVRGKAQVLVIKRIARGRNAGQWALPGGKVEVGETACEAALREAQEEVGLDPEGADVLGFLDDFPTMTGFRITPYVVRAPTHWRPVRLPDEVHSLHPVPVSRLVRDDVARWLRQRDGSSLLQMRLRHDMLVHAPTGAMLLQFCEVALRGRQISVADLVQPEFTHM